MTFKQKEDVTHIEDYFLLDTRFPNFVENLFSEKIRSAVNQNLNKMKTLLEQRNVTLQNGKRVFV